MIFDLVDGDAKPIVPITADGVIVQRGQFIWRVRDYGMPSRSMVTRSLLRVWSYWCLHESAYADEQNAMKAALAHAKERLKRAKQDAKREARTIERLKERMR